MAPAWLKTLLPDGFMLALIGSVVLASLAPVHGEGAAIVGHATTGAVMLLFFLHGVRLSRDTMIGGLTHWRLHLTILAITFAIFPLIGLAMARVMPGALPDALWPGLIYLTILPSTVQSSVAFVSIARGNVAAALCSAAASNMLGVILTPLLAGLLFHAHGLSTGGGIGPILVQLLLPFLAGHLLRPWLKGWASRHATLLKLTDRGAILLTVYGAFSGAVVEGIWHRIDLPEMLALVFVSGLLLALALGISLAAARLQGFSREDEIAILFCGSKKSLISGVPMARVLFAGPTVGITILPIMIFHQIQLMVCAWLARRYADRFVP